MVEDCVLFELCVGGNDSEFESRYGNDRSILDRKITALQETSLHLASRYNHRNLVSKILRLDAHSFVQYIRNEDKHSALFVACSCEHLEVALTLCDVMDFKAWDDIGASCLWLAASRGYRDVVVNILGKNPSLASRKDENGFSAMHLAAREGQIEVINELLRSHRNLINIADNDGNTILHHAATGYFPKILEILVQEPRMNVNAVNKRGMTALDILERQQASTEESKRVIQQLKVKKRASPISVTPLQEALMVVAALICTIAFQAGLNPPGGFWPDSNGTNQTDHTAGKAIQNTTNPWVFWAFTVFDAMAFATALSLIPAIMILTEKTMTYVNSLAVVALICTEVTFILGLVMVSDGKRCIISEIGALLLPQLFFLRMLWKA